MANKHIKRCSMSLVIREIQIKTTMRHHFTAIKMNVMGKKKKSEDEEKLDLIHYYWVCKMVWSLKNWWFFKKLNIKSLNYPTIPLLGI